MKPTRLHVRVALFLALVAARPLTANLAAGDSLVDQFRRDHSGEGEAALRLARSAVEHACRTREPLPLPHDLSPLMAQRGAVFVSAMVYGKPRCCMGTLIPREPTLAQEIIANAFAAAVHDKRFPPIHSEELNRLRVIVSIIGDSHPITNLDSLDPLRDGLAVRGSRDTSVVLPGETADVKTMVRWGRIRAGTKPAEKCQYLQLEVIRFIEAPRNPAKEVRKDASRA